MVQLLVNLLGRSSHLESLLRWTGNLVLQAGGNQSSYGKLDTDPHPAPMCASLLADIPSRKDFAVPTKIIMIAAPLNAFLNWFFGTLSANVKCALPEPFCLRSVSTQVVIPRSTPGYCALH